MKLRKSVTSVTQLLSNQGVDQRRLGNILAEETYNAMLQKTHAQTTPEFVLSKCGKLITEGQYKKAYKNLRRYLMNRRFDPHTQLRVCHQVLYISVKLMNKYLQLRVIQMKAKLPALLKVSFEHLDLMHDCLPLFDQNQNWVKETKAQVKKVKQSKQQIMQKQKATLNMEQTANPQPKRSSFLRHKKSFDNQLTPRSSILSVNNNNQNVLTIIDNQGLVKESMPVDGLSDDGGGVGGKEGALSFRSNNSGSQRFLLEGDISPAFVTKLTEQKKGQAKDVTSIPVSSAFNSSSNINNAEDGQDNSNNNLSDESSDSPLLQQKDLIYRFYVEDCVNYELQILICAYQFYRRLDQHEKAMLFLSMAQKTVLQIPMEKHNTELCYNNALALTLVGNIHMEQDYCQEAANSYELAYPYAQMAIEQQMQVISQIEINKLSVHMELRLEKYLQLICLLLTNWGLACEQTRDLGRMYNCLKLANWLSQKLLLYETLSDPIKEMVQEHLERVLTSYKDYIVEIADLNKIIKIAWKEEIGGLMKKEEEVEDAVQLQLKEFQQKIYKKFKYDELNSRQLILLKNNATEGDNNANQLDQSKLNISNIQTPRDKSPSQSIIQVYQNSFGGQVHVVGGGNEQQILLQQQYQPSADQQRIRNYSTNTLGTSSIINNNNQTVFEQAKGPGAGSKQSNSQNNTLISATNMHEQTAATNHGKSNLNILVNHPLDSNENSFTTSGFHTRILDHQSNQHQQTQDNGQTSSLNQKTSFISFATSNRPQSGYAKPSLQFQCSTMTNSNQNGTNNSNELQQFRVRPETAKSYKNAFGSNQLRNSLQQYTTTQNQQQQQENNSNQGEDLMKASLSKDILNYQITNDLNSIVNQSALGNQTSIYNATNLFLSTSRQQEEHLQILQNLNKSPSKNANFTQVKQQNSAGKTSDFCNNNSSAMTCKSPRQQVQKLRIQSNVQNQQQQQKKQQKGNQSPSSPEKARRQNEKSGKKRINIQRRPQTACPQNPDLRVRNKTVNALSDFFDRNYPQQIANPKLLTTNKYFKSFVHADPQTVQAIDNYEERYDFYLLRKEQEVPEQRQGVQNLDRQIKEMIVNKLHRDNKTADYINQFKGFCYTMKNEDFDKKEFGFSKQELFFQQKFCHSQTKLMTQKERDDMEKFEKINEQIQLNKDQTIQQLKIQKVIEAENQNIQKLLQMSSGTLPAQQQQSTSLQGSSMQYLQSSILNKNSKSLKRASLVSDKSQEKYFNNNNNDQKSIQSPSSPRPAGLLQNQFIISRTSQMQQQITNKQKQSQIRLQRDAGEQLNQKQDYMMPSQSKQIKLLNKSNSNTLQVQSKSQINNNNSGGEDTNQIEEVQPSIDNIKKLEAQKSQDLLKNYLVNIELEKDYIDKKLQQEINKNKKFKVHKIKIENTDNLNNQTTDNNTVGSNNLIGSNNYTSLNTKQKIFSENYGDLAQSTKSFTQKIKIQKNSQLFYELAKLQGTLNYDKLNIAKQATKEKKIPRRLLIQQQKKQEVSNKPRSNTKQ